MNKFLKIGGRPKEFTGTLRLPPSKSYVHRAIFIAALASDPSQITGCSTVLSDDVIATIETLRSFGATVRHSSELHGSLRVVPGKTNQSRISIYARGSGTTARFAISFAALAKEGTEVAISGDDSLSKRPMESIFESLSQLGVESRFKNRNGKLPILIKGGGIRGGVCEVDGSISSQFVSSLLISCTQALSDCTINIKDPSKLVSKPYIDATLAVLSHFGFKVKIIPSSKYKIAGFRIVGNQKVRGKIFSVPGDMSSAAALIGAALSSHGRLRLLGVNPDFPQPDAAMIPVAEKFGASVTTPTRGSLLVRSKQSNYTNQLNLDLNDSPDIVPVVAGLSASLGRRVKISNIAHLRFKESDRISVLSRELTKLGIKTRESASSLSVLAGDGESKSDFRKPIHIDPERDHRMLMALAIAGLSGRYGELRIRDPDCVRKSYPTFVHDLQQLCHEKNTVKILRGPSSN